MTQRHKEEIIEEALARGDLGRTIRPGRSWEERRDQRECQKFIDKCKKRNEEDQEKERAEAEKDPGNLMSSGGMKPYLPWRVMRGGRNGELYRMTKDAKRDRNQTIQFKAKGDAYPANDDEILFNQEVLTQPQTPQV